MLDVEDNGVTLTPQQQECYRRAKDATEHNNPDYAVALLQGLCSQCPEFVEARRLLRANAIMKFKKASGLARKMAGIKTAPLAVKGRNALKRSPAEALQFAEEILEVDPYSSQGNILLADASRALDNNQTNSTVLLAYETIREGHPNDIDNLKRLAKAYFETREAAKAQTVYAQILQKTPTDGEAIQGQKDAAALLASQKGNWDEGKDYRESLKDQEESKRYEEASRAVTSDEGLDKILEDLGAQYEQNNQNLDVVKRIAQVYERKKDLPSAIQWWAYAFSLSNNTDPVIEKTLYTLNLKQIEDAIRQISHALQTAPPEQQPQLQEQLQQLEAQHSEFILENLRAQVEKYPNDKELRYNLGQALFDLGQYKEATPYLQEGSHAPNVRHKALNALGLCFWKREIFDLAEKQFDLAKSDMAVMDDMKKEVIYNLASVKEAAGKPEEALAEFKIIYEIDYRYRDVAARVEASYGK